MSCRNGSSVAPLLVGLTLALGCSGATGGSGDAGGGGDAQAAADGGAQDAAATRDAATAAKQDLNGCTAATYQDRTGASADRTLAWQLPLPVACIKVSKGQSVKWSGKLDAHPLLQKGGDPVSPIQATSAGTEVAFTFPAEGVFGFVCDAHPDMIGAVWVAP